MCDTAIDFHIHLTPQLDATPGPPVTRYAHGIPVYTEHGLLADVEGLLSFLDGAGIDIAVLTSGHGMRAEPDGARAANEALAAVCREHPERLRFLAHAAPTEGDEWLSEVEQWLDRCPGAVMPSKIGERRLDDPTFEPLYDLLERRKRFLFVHPALVPSEVEARLYDAFDLYRAVGREFSLVTATVSLIVGGVLDRHPDLKVVMSHLGGGITSLVPRIRHYQDKAMWGVEDDPTHGRTPQRPFDDYLGRIYFDTGGFFGSPEAVQAALLHIPRSQLLPGTDYPQEIRSVGRARELMEFLRGEGVLGNGSELLDLGG